MYTQSTNIPIQPFSAQKDKWMNDMLDNDSALYSYTRPQAVETKHKRLCAC